MSFASRVSAALLAGCATAALADVSLAADFDRERVYYAPAVPAPTFPPVADYDDTPAPLYYGPVIRAPVYGYGPVVRGRPVYRYAPVRSRPRREYGYAPTISVAPPAPAPLYGYAPAPTFVRPGDKRPLGVYAPRNSENLSESRSYFRAIKRQSGGE
ncbi:MAG: hypothetical protein R3D44_06320 [Hyphomicrobiaceae bacterium]